MPGSVVARASCRHRTTGRRKRRHAIFHGAELAVVLRRALPVCRRCRCRRSRRVLDSWPGTFSVYWRAVSGALACHGADNSGTADRPPITHTYYYYASPSFSLSPFSSRLSTGRVLQLPLSQSTDSTDLLANLDISTHLNPSQPIYAPTFLASPTTHRYIPTEEVPAADLEDIINRSCTAFRDPGVTPVVKTGDCWTMELFHGPTFAFKDVALQFLGNLFEYFIERKEGDAKRLTIMGATSGDTGSAAVRW